MMNYISKKVKKALGLIALTGLSGLMSAQSMNWSLAGPVYNAGRVRNILIDKLDATGNTIYAGSTSSGLFKTTDGGINWGPLNDQGTIRNISYMAQGSDGSIFVGTGEGFLRPGQLLKAQRGTGIYKLNGSTLVNLQDSNAVGAVINRVACNPADVNVIALATNRGIMISTNGASFSSASTMGIPTVVNSTYGMDVKFDNAGYLYCSIGNERGTVFSVNFSNVPSKVYKSSAPVTSGSTVSFNDITPTSSVLSDSNYGRIELAIAPSNNNVIYASCARKSNNAPNSASLQGLFVSYDGGATWGLILQGASQLDPLTNGGTIASGDYAHVLTVNPTVPDQLFVGGYGFYVFTRTGGSNASPIGSWTQLGSNFAVNTAYYLHENIHDIKIINTSNPVKFYFVTDAGIYRSLDMYNLTVTNPFPSFQPFYKGLVTGQFNSVSIQTFPLALNTSTDNGTAVVPAAGFIGGTGGNGLNYFSGSNGVVSQETSYLSGEVYNSEFSKILNDAAFLSTANGGLYRSTDVKSSEPTLTNFNTYTGPLSRIAPTTNPFSVAGVSSGTPFKLWENYGQLANGPDFQVFYNDTLRALASIVGLATLTTQSTFTFSSPRPNPAALIDSIVVRTGTVVLPVSGVSASVATAFTEGQTINIKLANNYVVTPTITVPPISGTVGPVSAVGVTLDATSSLDNISVTFTAPPFINKTTPFYPTNATGTNIVVPDPAAYYRVFATVYYKYKVGDVVSVTDNNISTRTTTYTAQLTQPLNWQYGSTGVAYTLSATGSTAAITNPTYVLTPGNISQTSPVFTVHPVTVSSYTITNTGTYSVSATPVVYTLTASTDTNIPAPYSYTLNPGNITQTTTVFTVSPVTTTAYTITQSGTSSTLTNMTYSTVNSSTYALSPGTATPQSSPVFTVNVTASPVVYTLTGTASSTAGTSTSMTYTFPVSTFSTVGGTSVPFAAHNPPIKIRSSISARLALVINNTGINGAAANAVVVSKSPLNLNDPLNFVRLSQDGCLTTKADGSPDSVNTITIPGKPTILQWSNKGTELYYATDANKLYRISFINLIMDYSPSSYSGKLSTDVFKYTTTGNGGIASTGVNLNSPYRTTMIGSFTKRITSISISSDDQALAVTFDDPSGNLISYSNHNIDSANASNINFVTKNGTTGTPFANVKTYCSLMEKNNPKTVFVGTDQGIYYTNDITATPPTWVGANANVTDPANQLPNVQIFDIKQQTMSNSACYNSGEIYVATNGRGVWTNSKYFSNSYVSIQEYEKNKSASSNISIFPNPTNGNVSITFDGVDGESAVVNVMDLSGRIIKSENLGKLSPGEGTYSVETTSLTSGIYLVNVSSTSGVKRVAKLIVTK